MAGMIRCGLVLLTAVWLAGCAPQAPSLLDDPHPYDAALPPFSTPVTCEEIRLAFYKYSGPAIVRKLTEGDAANWTMILAKIEAGDPEWITCAAAYIAPGTDAGATTDLLVALAFGLPRNPQAVLSQEVGLGLSMLSVCSLPFIEPTYDFVKSYGEETVAALLRVDEPYLLDARDTCLRRMREALDRAETVFASGHWDE